MRVRRELTFVAGAGCLVSPQRRVFVAGGNFCQPCSKSFILVTSLRAFAGYSISRRRFILTAQERFEFGMSLSNLNKTLHTSLSKPADPEERSSSTLACEVSLELSVMILEGGVARVDVDGKTTQTDEGIRNGEARALQIYGRE